VTTPSQTHLEKKSLRARMRRLTASLQPVSAAVAEAVEKWLLEHPAARTIAAYAALPGEVDLLHITACHPDRRWVFPRVDGHNMRFHVVESPDSGLTSGAFGVREPCPSLPCVKISEIDAFFCPGLAFDAQGGRLGRGMGYYDRALAHARPGALKIGVCFRPQLVDDTFTEAHDIAMDDVICC
jgi:5-formyltetrahydrofolate cyclo-ligase